MRIVVDSSALVAIGTFEPDRPAFIRAIETASEILISPINYVETGVVLTGRGHFVSRQAFDEWLSNYRVRVAAEPAIDALAKSLDAPLLYKGDDFRMTDVRSALDV